MCCVDQLRSQPESGYSPSINFSAAYRCFLVVEMSGKGCVFVMDEKDISGHIFLLGIQKQIMDDALKQLEGVNKPKAVSA